MTDYEVTALDADGFEISRSIELNLKAAKAQARYFVSQPYARDSGVNIRKAEIRAYGKPECLWDVFA